MFSWIPVKVVAEARKALDWLEEKQRLQGTLRKTDDPVLTAADIKKREDTIVRFADPILSKPAPPPPKVRGVSLPPAHPIVFLSGLCMMWGCRLPGKHYHSKEWWLPCPK